MSVHKKGILHRDIKPLNILLTEDFTAKLSDFGVSIELESADNDKMKGSEGTYHFMAPESLKSEGNEDGYSGKMADLWALGITLYCLTYLKLPFFDNSILILIQNIGNKEVEFFKSRTISEDLRNLISKMLEKNVKNRLNFDELTKNSWINKDCQNLYDELI